MKPSNRSKDKGANSYRRILEDKITCIISFLSERDFLYKSSLINFKYKEMNGEKRVI
ncbi:hypothetical protein TEMA_39790 [Terrisporobacter mayombei]|uniref:Uncharacterized protein n=1 Tax=Terrisporobacter mayombei TaxID=1541 RepID=A0ABY9Q642_9FIRM|nr:hypothetical protein TEMA_39790 [Terrisporobacter mayombei]